MAPSNLAKPQRIPAWLRSALLILVLAASGALFGFTLAKVSDRLGLIPELDLSVGEALLLLPALPFVWFLVVLLHELGHLFSGMAAGFRPYLLIVGPLQLRWIEGQLRVELNRNINLAGGMASAIPPDDRNLVRGLLLMVSGGPLASLVTGVLVLLAGSRLAGYPAAIALMLGSLALIIAVATSIPMRTGGFLSDGARLLMLLRGGPQAARWGAMALLLNATLAGRLRAVDPSIVERAAALRDDSPDAVSGAFLAYSYRLISGEFVEAGAQLDYVLEHLASYPAGVRPAIRVEAAYFLGRHRDDPGAARALLELTKGAAGVEIFARHRAEAALLLAERRLDEARAAVASARDALDHARLGALAHDELALLAELEQAIAGRIRL